MAAIVRNSRGEAVAGAAEIFSYASSVASAEAMALYLGLRLVCDIGCSKITMESDCLELVTACNGGSEILASYTAILYDAFQLAHEISSIQFRHCPREANKLAHALARHAYDSTEMILWDDLPPNFLLPHVLNDVTLSNLQ